MTETVLLTGGAGFIGSHTYIALAKAGYRTVILDNFANAKRSVLDRLERITGAPVISEEASILDRTALDRILVEHNIVAVIHFAALKQVGESVVRPLAYMDTNLNGLVTLLQAMEGAGVAKLVFSSSATVYGDPETVPVPETAPLGYQNPYGFTKLTGEQILAQAATANHAWRFGILRYFNPAGAHASGLIGEDPMGTPANLFPYVARVALGVFPEIQVFGNDYPTPDGTGVRDYLHVSDLAEGHVCSLEALARTGEGHVVNLGTGRGYSVLEVIAAYGKACGRDLPYRIAPRRTGDVAACYADVGRARDLIGFEAVRGIEEMCASDWHWVQTGLKEI